MKKLLMMAVVACMVTFAQALTITWTSSTAVAGNAFALIYTAETSNPASIAAVAEILKGGTVDNYNKVNGATSTLWEPNTAMIQDVPDPAASTGTYYVFYYNDTDAYGATFDAATAKNENYWSGVNGKDPTAKELSLNFTKVAVPEPTALALLALGVAGVALRRRRRA